MVIAASVLMLLSGLGVFLLGMQMISKNLQKLASNNIGKMLAKISDNKLAGISLGAGAAALLESSSATTVILLGLVNAGIVNLVQATLIIMGANIGTTFTVVLFSLSYLPVGELLSFVTLVGVIIVITGKNDRTRCLGMAIAGFGLIFVGLGLMSDSVEFLKTSEFFVRFLMTLDNPFLLLIVGMLVSAIVQSGSATTGIVITLAEAGLMPTMSTFFIIMGSNVGTCMTAILASLGSNLNSKRTAFIHLAFNVIGVVLFFPFAAAFNNKLEALISGVLNPSVLIAYFHVAFNLITTLVLVPFVKPLVRLSTKILPDKVYTSPIEKKKSLFNKKV